ncbi:MAG: hypothetical protein WBD22_02340 [Pyrinomonadaceae bacterium]
MRSNRRTVPTILFCLVTTSIAAETSVVAQSATTVDWKAKFLSDAPAAARRLEAAVSSWQGSWDTTRVSSGLKGRREIRAKGEYFLNERVGGALLIVSVIPDDGTAGVYGFNDRYDFVLGKHRPPDHFIESYTPAVKDAPRDMALLRADEAECFHPLLAAECASGVWFSELGGEKKSAMTLRSATPYQEKGRLLLRLDYDLNFPDSNKPDRGFAVVDPERHWAVLSYETRFSWGGAIAQQVQYRDDVTEVAFPKRIVRITSSGANIETVTRTLGKPIACEARERDFTLEAFNLTPPGSGRPTVASNVSKYAIINSILLVTVGVFFLFLYFRRQQRARVVS